MEGKREAAPVLTPTAACSAGPCSSGGERSRERREGLMRGGSEAEDREREMRMKEGDDDVFIYNLGKITIYYPKVYS